MVPTIVGPEFPDQNNPSGQVNLDQNALLREILASPQHNFEDPADEYEQTLTSVVSSLQDQNDKENFEPMNLREKHIQVMRNQRRSIKIEMEKLKSALKIPSRKSQAETLKHVNECVLQYQSTVARLKNRIQKLEKSNGILKTEIEVLHKLNSQTN